MLYLGWLLVFIGLFFIVSGVVGIFRFPDFYAKIHAAGVTECCGIPFCLVGMSLMQDDYINSMKLIAVVFLILVLNPISTHALGRASLLYKIDDKGRIK